MKVHKVLGTEDPADLMTKNLAASSLEKCMKMLSQEVRDGRADKSLTIVKMEEHVEESKLHRVRPASGAVKR